MPDYVCIIQQGQAADQNRDVLAAGLTEIANESLGQAAPGNEIAWSVVEPGYAFTAGEPSTSSLIIRSVPSGFPSADREAFMRSVTSLWERVTGCSTEETVVTTWDGPLPL